MRAQTWAAEGRQGSGQDTRAVSCWEGYCTLRAQTCGSGCCGQARLRSRHEGRELLGGLLHAARSDMWLGLAGRAQVNTRGP